MRALARFNPFGYLSGAIVPFLIVYLVSRMPRRLVTRRRCSRGAARRRQTKLLTCLYFVMTVAWIVALIVFRSSVVRIQVMTSWCFLKKNEKLTRARALSRQSLPLAAFSFCIFLKLSARALCVACRRS